jgi:hypothetical protein
VSARTRPGHITPARVGPYRSHLLTKVGSVSVKRKVATTAAVAALTGGLVMVSASARSMYIAMTGRRLLFFDGHTASGKPGQQVPRPCREDGGQVISALRRA